MLATFLAWSRRAGMLCALILAGGLTVADALQAGEILNRPALPEVTNVLLVSRLALQNSNAAYAIHLTGDIWWANLAQGKFILKDDSGAVELEMELPGQSLQPGRRVRVEGDATVTGGGESFILGARGPVVDNDGIHSMSVKSGAVYLHAGRQPVRLDWFNDVEKSGLQVEYEGGGLPRQKIPDAVLFRTPVPATDGGTNLVSGLNFLGYEFNGTALPDFSRLTAVKSGAVSNFDLRVASRGEHVGLRFTGFLDVPRDGLYAFHLQSDDGSQLFVGEPSLRVTTVGRSEFPAPRAIVPGQILPGDEGCSWASVEGRVTFVGEHTDGLELELSSGTGRMRVQVANDAGLLPARLLNSRIRALGVCQGACTTDGQKVANILLVSDAGGIELAEASREGAPPGAGTEAATLPLLTTGAEVHRLKREDAQRGYPARIRGVITCVVPERQAFVIQDSTRGLYIEDHSEVRSGPPQIGEFLEAEGTTDPSLFAPIVAARRLRSLGAGHLPEPVHPTWDQLMNGSMDAQYVELQGIVTAVNTNEVTLLTQDGRINLELRMAGRTSPGLEQYEDALVRVRGCLFASWDYVTHQVKVGEILIRGAHITVDQPTPADMFAIPKKTAAELLLFDPQASVFQRVKVAGQIVHAGETEFDMMDGGRGVSFIPKKPAALAAGDLVEVVGFPELSGAAPVLRESVVRKTGRAQLPAARKLPPDELIRADYDSTLVRVEGVLVGARSMGAAQELEMQSGVRTFLARLSRIDPSVASLPVGSRLELTGVYAGQGGNRALGHDIASFELLLNSPADIKVLARPPWWTLERMLIIVGALACVLAITVLWITQLHRKVEERTAELEVQIHERQRVEHQRAMEQERTRIAQDLHDELGSGITEVSMLVTVAESVTAPGESLSPHLKQIGDRSRQMVTALDEIVWTMNPRHDSLASLVSYSCLYADRFLKLANIACRLKGAVDLPDKTVNSVHRHEFFLAFKEALTNVVRHSGATEVRLGVRLIGDRLRLSIADNGGGLVAGDSQPGGDGLPNMRARLEKMGGRFEIASQRGRGTTVRFYIPLN